MPGIILIDEGLQANLSRRTSETVVHDRTTPLPVAAAPSRARQVSDSHTTISNNSADVDVRSFATLGGSTGKPSIATLGASPRTNFTTRTTAQSHRAPQAIDTHSLPPHDEPDPWMYDELHQESHDSSTTGLHQSQDLSIKLVLVGIAAGFVLGVILQAVKVSPLVAQWVGLPGQLFLRALQCIVVPYVFCSVAVAIGDIVYVGKISIVGFQTFKIFLITWVTTSIMGLGLALAFRPMFHPSVAPATKTTNAFGINCANHELLTMLANGTVMCSVDSNSTASATAVSTESVFKLTDVNGMFATTTQGNLPQRTLGELLRAIILYVVTPNLTASFVKRELLSIIVCAMVVGAIAGRNYFSKTRRVNYLYLSLVQLRNALLMMLDWVIALTPLALVSFIASFMANSLKVFEATHVYYYVLAMLCGGVIHAAIILPAIVFLSTQCNPFAHMKQMVRAYFFAFACSSSLATMPVTISCIKRARVCSQSLSNFVVSIGVSCNTSALGFYVPIAVMFLYESTGTTMELSVLRLVGLFVLSLIACLGSPPIPSAGLIIVQTVYTSLFRATEMPPGMIYIIAVDFIVDRIATMCNVHDDIMAVKIIAENTDETVVSEHLGERQ